MDLIGEIGLLHDPLVLWYDQIRLPRTRFREQWLPLEKILSKMERRHNFEQEEVHLCTLSLRPNIG